MSENSPSPQLKLDPWAASSLLQKAIRRGDCDLAKQAALLFYRYRGAAIWRRLFHIAVEDVGIANIALVSNAASIATDKPLRNILGSDTELIQDICDQLASSPKDRSADYLISMVELEGLEPATYEPEPSVGRLVSSAGQVLRECTVTRKGNHTLNDAAVRQLLAKGWKFGSGSVENILFQAAKCRAEPFALMLLPLWSVLIAENLEVSVGAQPLPETELVDGIPLFVFDKHTAIGKAAISSFARENLDMRNALSHWVAAAQRVKVAEIAAFYADAMPVARKLRWSKSKILEELGCHADMVLAGCAIDGIPAVLETTRHNLDDLNMRRQRAFRRARK